MSAIQKLAVAEFDGLCDRITELMGEIKARRKSEPGWKSWEVANGIFIFRGPMAELVESAAKLNGMESSDQFLEAMFRDWIRNPDRWAIPVEGVV